MKIDWGTIKNEAQQAVGFPAYGWARTTLGAKVLSLPVKGPLQRGTGWSEEGCRQVYRLRRQGPSSTPSTGRSTTSALFSESYIASSAFFPNYQSHWRNSMPKL